MIATNITAGAVNTIEWLSTAKTTIAVPVYQRQYRWEIDGCEQLLADVRAVATGFAGQTHFFGSILYTATSGGEATEWMLVDGQQRSPRSCCWSQRFATLSATRTRRLPASCVGCCYIQQRQGRRG